MGSGTVVIVVVAAGVAMIVQDVLGTLMTMAENRHHAWWAGLLDAGMWLTGLFTTLWGAGDVILHGWNAHSIAVIATITAANVLGTALGVTLGDRLMPKETDG